MQKSRNRGIASPVSSSRLGFWLVVLSSVFFASMAVLARHLSSSVPPLQLSFVRFAVGSTAMLGYFVLRRQRPDTRHPVRLVLRGLFGSGAVMTYFFALERLGTGPATVLNYCSPIYAAVFASLFLNERPTRLTWLGLGLATLGAMQVSASTGEFSQPLHPGLGGLAGLASGVLGGAAITVIRSLRNDTNAPTVFFAFSLVGLIITAPLAATHWVPLEGRVAWLTLGMGLLSIGGQLLFTLALGYTSASAGSATTQLVPVLAWVFAVGVLAEPASWPTLAGALLCVSGVLLGAIRRHA